MLVNVYFIVVSPTLFFYRQNASFDQSFHYSLHGTLGNAYLNCYFSRRGLRRMCQANKHMCVVTEKSPALNSPAPIHLIYHADYNAIEMSHVMIVYVHLSTLNQDGGICSIQTVSLDYLTDIIILLAAAVIVVPLSRLARLGIVPGFLIAGVAVGPSVLGLIDNQAEIGHLAELGVVLLLFVIGIELKPSRLWLMRRMVFGLGALQVVVTGVLISVAVIFVFNVDLQSALLIGPALALSSTAFVLQLLIEQKMLNSNYGRTSIAVLLFQDLAVVPLLALVSLLAVTEFSIEKDIGLALLETLMILALVIIGGRYLLQPILHLIARLGSPEIFTTSAVLLVLGTAVLLAQVGLSMAMGAFVAGLLVADSEFRHQVAAEIQPFRGLLLGLFFMSMGMSLNLKVFFAEPLSFIGLVLVLMFTKVTILWMLLRLFGHKGGVAQAVSLLLAQSGEFALILFALAFDSALLSEELFQQLLVIVVLSMLATPPLARLAHRLAVSRRSEQVESEFEEMDVVSKAIVIVGFGHVGRKVGEILEIRKVPYVAVDNDAGVVKRGRNAGRSVFYGDARQPDVLRSLGVGEARLVIVTVDDFQATEQVVSSLHHSFPKMEILVRGHDLENCRSLKAQGAWFTVSENLEASTALARAALSQVRANDAENELIIDQFRRDYYSDPKRES
ncbi:MAG: monovalent cation:proton antiporter-2 (CPA2) family protein [Xanthomonadales bacterium]|nr:monovalent cation:proton antiporter-2 (CPA2) family protein [Xanthomonadales bacterium]